MMLVTAGLAWAIDAHGPVLIPRSADLLAPEVAWDPVGLERGAWGISLTGEYGHAPLVAHLDLGAEQRDEIWLDQLVGTSLSGVYSLGPVGLGATLPVWWMHSGEAPEGVSLGDIAVWAPIGLLPARDGRLGLLVVPELTVPTGDPTAWLGSGLGGGLRIAAGQQAEHLDWSAELGASYHPEDVLYDIDRSLLIRADLAGGWRVGPRLGVGAEAWIELAPLTPGLLAGSPGEILARGSFRVGERLTVGVAGGTGLTAATGAADARAYLRVGYGTVQAPAKATPAPAAPIIGPYTLRLDVVGPDGRPIDARVEVTGAVTLAPAQTGADGHEDLVLAPGEFDVRVRKDGYLGQRHHLVLEPDRFRPAELRVVLQPSEGGDTNLFVSLRDTEGRAVVGAELRLDGRELGASSTGGDVEIDGLIGGPHVVAVSSPEFRPEEPVTVDTRTQSAATIVLDRPAGSVKVVCRGEDGPVPDAQVAFFGPEDLAPSGIGDDGEQTFVLLPGDWEVQVSAPAFGLQERSIHVEAGSTALVLVDVRLLHAEGGDAELVVRVVDPDGAPVDQARVRIDDKAVGATSNGGELRLRGLKPGVRTVTVSGDHFRDAAPRDLELTGGVRELEMVLGWKPGSIEIVARGVEGAVTDAQVMLDGPETIAPTSLGPDGRGFFQVTPGTWHVMLSAPSYGLQERDVVVRSDDTQLIEIDASLLAQAGDAALELRVVDPDGRPVDGARVLVDGRDAGTTATSGNLRIEGLPPARHTLSVSGGTFQPWSKDHGLVAGTNTLTAKLGWSPTAVRVRARGPDGPARDALARFYGVEDLPPSALVPDGERIFELLPGLWTLVVSSQTLGFVESDVDVRGGTKLPQLVDVTLAPATAGRRLLVVVVDPSGRPVAGGRLRAGDSVTELGDDGMVVLDGLTGDRIAIRASAPGFRDGEPQVVQVSEGVSSLRVRLRPLPRPIAVQVVDGAQQPVAATVRLSGPGRPITTASTGSGKAEARVLPGTWQVLVEAKGYGAWRADVPVLPGEAPLPVVATLAPIRAEVTATGVSLREQVQFDFDQATIRAESYPLLEQIAAMLLLHPEIARLEVQGHTDARGTEAYNLDLSQRRAEAVVAYLVRRGVDAGRLSAVGFGATRPLGTNETEEGRTKNRRVQFDIVPAAAP